MLRADAQKMGISVEELIKRIMGGGQNVVGHLGAGTIPQGPTFISAHGGGVWNDIEPRVQEPIDDFEQLAEDRERALIEAGGDDLAREALFRKGVHGELQQDAAFVRNAPPSASGALYGTQAQVTSGQDPKTVARWNAPADVESTQITVTLSALAQFNGSMNFGPGPAILKPFARILFGTSAYAFTVDVDIGQGTILVVNGSMINVSVGLPALVGADAGANPITQTIAGAISFANTVRTTPVYRSFFIQSAAVGGTINVPTFAKRVWFFRGGIDGQTKDLPAQFLNSNGTIMYVFDLAANTVQTAAVPLTTDIVQILIPPQAYGNSVTILFELAL